MFEQAQRLSLGLKQTISCIIPECKNVRQLEQIHTQIVTSPFLLPTYHHFLISRLLFFCAIPDSGSLSYATAIFRRVSNPSLQLYNIMIRAHASKIGGEYDPGSPQAPAEALILYRQMVSSGIAPDCITVPFVVKECARRVDVGMGRGIHGQAIKFGVCDDGFVGNSLISFYSKFGYLGNARKVFDEMLDRDVVSWNSMVIGYLRSGDLDEALVLFRKMESRNVITWNSIITGFVQGGRSKEALQFFHELLCSSDGAVRPDKISIASVLSACAHLGAIDHGKWVHGYLRRRGLECDMVMGTALVDMYGKCGSVETAYDIFKAMPKKDTLTWTAMISVFALHGYCKEAFETFEQMQAEGLKPSHVTFVGLLSACAHSGLVEKGRWCFEAMRSVYLIEPQVHHYACMVDILARAGLFEEAEELIRSMPMVPDVFVWGALLGGCQMHGNVWLGERVGKLLIDLEPQNHAFYVNFCDMYAKAGRFDDVKRVRALMKERGIRKEVQGCSMIEVDGIVYEFSVLGSPNIEMEELDLVLTSLRNEMSIKAI